MAAVIHVGDIGTKFETTFKDENDAIVDIGPATQRTIYFLKPNGVVLTKTLSLTTDGSDGKGRYFSIAGDLSIEGKWEAQGFVVFTNGQWHATRVCFTVYPNIA